MEAFEGLPNISEQIMVVMKHYDDALVKAYECYDSANVDRFVDAWLETQKDQATRQYYHDKRSKQAAS